ncbi:MAG TPA: Glu-tRNA(Gln) amidotransferase subunit GatE [bacterium]|nr:Glu-tRNA(Gln) amidotransferase subunit GatE [bacterium]
MPAITNVKPFGTLADDDYREIGFRGGLEIHQQLLTASKLFCRCPAGLYSYDYDAKILRHMRPTLSEMGEYDGTALMEFKTRKNIIYRTKQKSCCTYEMDDTPPFDMDEESIDAGLKVSLLLNCNVVAEMHIIRKQYLDGSIPTGFQRTAIVGVEGYVPYRGRRIGIKQLAVEEDSCREVSDEGHERTYLTDRLGMPLIETVTHPDMETPWEIAEVGQLLRRLTRSTGLVRTGIGAAREDVNVSVAGGTRVEIKGVPRLKAIPRLVHNEAMRQRALLDIRAELKRRGITARSFRAAVEDVSGEFAKNARRPPGRAVLDGGRVYAVALRGYRGILGARTQETKHFVDEISDRVRVVACLDRLPNIFDDETSRRRMDGAIWRRLRRKLKTDRGDVVVLVWGPPADARLGADEVVLRAREATLGVPSDTRQALADGTNGFERILPGPDRMYPDTDRPPITISEERVAALAADLPEPIWAREERYREGGVPEDCIAPLAASRWVRTFEKAVNEYGVEAKFAATVFMHKLKGWRRRGRPVDELAEGDVERAFSLYGRGKITREGVVAALEAHVSRGVPLRRALNDLRHGREARERVAAAVKRVKRKVKRRRFPAGPAAVKRFAMGELMAEFRGLIPGAELAQIATEEISPAAG